MAGLLDGFGDFIKTPEGQGLLAATFGGLAGARSGAPINSLGRAGLAGMQGYTGAIDRQQQMAEAEQAKRARDMQMQTQQMQLDAAKAQEAKRVWMEDLTKKHATRQTPTLLGDSILPNDLKSGIQTSQGSPAGFDFEGYAQELASRDPMESLKWKQLLQKDDAPIKLGANEVLLSGKASGYKPLYTAPAKPEGKPTKVQEYEYAKANGYKGTLEQYVSIGPALMAAAQAPLRNAQIDNIVQENAYNLPPPPRPAKPAAARAPMRGQVVDGYRFKGGDPAIQSNWEKQ
jgi:hypothetical protein